jgi:hypothetical protein
MVDDSVFGLPRIVGRLQHFWQLHQLKIGKLQASTGPFAF